MYEDDLGVLQDHAKAKAIYELAAAQGNASAQYNLAYMYEYGLGIPVNYQKTREWYKKNCDNGDSDGCREYQDLLDK